MDSKADVLELAMIIHSLRPLPSMQDIIPVLVNGLLAFTVIFARPEDLDIRLSTLVTLFLALVAVQFVIADQVGAIQD